MSKSKLPTIKVSEETILEKIYVTRGQKVMLNKDLAEMYGVPTFSYRGWITKTYG